ncbi:cell wall hydrolase [Geomesophilobacter sediminis]|uniref:Cell wall hydrolase n=1 Tax=Geomesophilobacter sediminis TaxID=2798584 RepID=A0A8J7JD45_9BACT|nr:cell wall hydrolase [Geomesophilobacter sediminis]MBJ6725256.1 cell wall hydrolase [Geomesophilobacter sediminis]
MGRWALVIGIATICMAGDAAAAGESQQVEGATAKKKAHVLEKKVAGEVKKTVPVAPIKKTEAQAVDPAGKAPLNDAITCLSRAIYWEARGEGPAEMEAIASVVMNRLGHEGFPDTVCKVVKEGRKHGSCQFSWWCDGHSNVAKDENSYATAKEISRRALNRQLPDRTGGALYFHLRTVHPRWAREYLKTGEIGRHIFYKPRGGTAK